jgi:hypothetical protein
MGTFQFAVAPGYRANLDVRFNSDNETELKVEDLITGEVIADFRNWRKVGNNWVHDNSGGSWVSDVNESETAILYLLHGRAKTSPPNDEGAWNEISSSVLYHNSSETELKVGWLGFHGLQPHPTYNDITSTILLKLEDEDILASGSRKANL